MNPLRDYQEEDVKAVMDAWRETQSVLGIAATGLGKTRVAVEVAKRMMPGRGLFLAHRGELIWQARRSFLEAGLDCEVEKAELAAANGLFEPVPMVLASVDTLKSGKVGMKRMRRFNPKLFKFLIYDEGHHSVSKGNLEIVDYFTSGNPEMRVLGLTATPDRMDEVNLGKVFKSICFDRDIEFGVDNGWLVEPVPRIATVGALDYSQVRETRNGELNEDDLAFILEQEEPVARMVQPTLEVMYGMPENYLLDKHIAQWREILVARGNPIRTLIFTVSVKQAELMCNYINRVMPGIAGWVCGKTPDKDRSDLYRSFEHGDTYVMVNVGVATEGYDNPNIGLIVFGRPTKSRALCAQIIGRGTRTLRGIIDGLPTKESRLLKIALSRKPYCQVLDFAANTGKHKLVTVFHLLAGNASPQAIERAIERVKKDKPKMSVRDLVKEEEELLKLEIEKARKIEESKRSGIVAKVRYTTQQVDPFDLMDVDNSQPRSWDKTKKLSPGICRMLKLQGINPDNIPYQEGMQVFHNLMYRLRHKLARPRQIATLKRYYPTLNYETLTADSASKILDQLATNHWKRVELTNTQEKK